MRRAVLLLAAALAVAARPARAAVWEITGWDFPAKGQQLQTFPKAKCGDTIKIACAPGVKAGIYKMNDQSGWCPPTFDKTTGTELSAVKTDCSAEFTIGENDKTFYLTSHGKGDCKAGLKMNVKLPPCNPNIGYAVVPAKLLGAQQQGANNGGSTNGTAFAVVPAAKTFNAAAAAAKVAEKVSAAGGAAAASSSSGDVAGTATAACIIVATLVSLLVAA